MSVTSTQSEILDAVLTVASEQGLSGLSVEAVADCAGVSRQTVYRHFTNRHRLVEHAILREEQVFIDRMLEAAHGMPTLGEAVAEAVATALRMARGHPVLARLVEREPAALLPYLLLGRGPVISAAEPAVADLISRYQPTMPPEALQLIADMATRLLVSYVVSPADVSDERLGQWLSRMIVQLTTA